MGFVLLELCGCDHENFRSQQQRHADDRDNRHYLLKLAQLWGWRQSRVLLHLRHCALEFCRGWRKDKEDDEEHCDAD